MIKTVEIKSQLQTFTEDIKEKPDIFNEMINLNPILSKCIQDISRDKQINIAKTNTP